MEKIYMIKLHYENRDEYEFEDEYKFAKTWEKALEIFEKMKNEELTQTWLAGVDFDKVDYFEDFRGQFICDDLGRSNLYTSIEIKQVEVEE